MFICSGDIALRSIVKADLELIRSWRNSAAVKQFMEFRESINSGQQISWFTNLNAQTDFYFLVFNKEKPVGVVNLKKINRDEGSAEAGIFMGEDNIRNTSFPVRATVLLMKIAFNWLGLRQLQAKVSTNNIAALKMNEVLGYRKLSDSATDFEMYVCSNENFSGSKLSNTVGQIHIELFNGDEWLLKKIKDHPDFIVEASF